MIIDETMVYGIEGSFKYNYDGEIGIDVKELHFLHPTPRLSSHIFKLRRFVGKAMANLAKVFAGVERGETTPELKSGSLVKPMHEQFTECADDPKKRERLIADIDERAEELESSLNLGDIDLETFTQTFANLVCQEKRCMIDGKTPLTMSIWNDSVMFDDRLKMAVKYCCFFGLTLNMMPKGGTK